MKKLQKAVVVSTLFTSSLFSFKSLAAETAPALPSAAAEAKQPSAQFNIGDGNPFSMKDIAITIVPPQGWEVITNSGDLTMVIQEPKPQFSSKNEAEVIFQRNITVARMKEASPIDEARAVELKKQLAERFGKNGLVSDFQVLEHQFIDYRNKKDALLVYTSLKIGSHPMMQMHILLSGQDQQLLLTYTDLDKRFVEDKATMQTAWTSMISTEVTGTAPGRYVNVMVGGAAGVTVVFALFFWGYMRKRAVAKLLVEDDGGEEFTSDDMDHANDDMNDESFSSVGTTYHEQAGDNEFDGSVETSEDKWVVSSHSSLSYSTH